MRKSLLALSLAAALASSVAFAQEAPEEITLLSAMTTCTPLSSEQVSVFSGDNTDDILQSTLDLIVTAGDNEDIVSCITTAFVSNFPELSAELLAGVSELSPDMIASVAEAIAEAEAAAAGPGDTTTEGGTLAGTTPNTLAAANIPTATAGGGGITPSSPN
ncbi:hypothetical protein [Nitrincola nitratireducens]|uniref:Uncharacterized protein n=1 Tax=Nitrincola nitratireducens TaxID=1229521 RepID=W9V3T6_9GAMM|nr:hypothetical protein [Nitrincola nitratireducens]EXJ10792.1 hypothetical protein D791_02157 [Nitrincola nitratireducens]